MPYQRRMPFTDVDFKDPAAVQRYLKAQRDELQQAQEFSIGVNRQRKSSDTITIGGSAVTVQPKSGKHISAVFNIEWVVTGFTTNITATIKAFYEDGTTTTVNKTLTANGTFFFTQAELASLWKDERLIEKIEKSATGGAAALTGRTYTVEG